MVFQNDTIVLRYIQESDIDDYICWATIETEWRDWDSPWEWSRYRDINAYNNGFIEQQRFAIKMPPKFIYRDLEIDDAITGRHIGWVKSYHMDDEREKTAVGIVLPSKGDRGKGFGERALVLYMTYLFNTKNRLTDSYTETLYAETWSGNIAMIRLAGKIGFLEAERKAKRHEIKGKWYDDIIFSISKKHFFDDYKVKSK